MLLKIPSRGGRSEATEHGVGFLMALVSGASPCWAVLMYMVFRARDIFPRISAASQCNLTMGKILYPRISAAKVSIFFEIDIPDPCGPTLKITGPPQAAPVHRLVGLL